jgi:hypothetical protein
VQQSTRMLEQSRQVRSRLRMIDHYEQVSRNVSQTCRFFCISRRQFYVWLGRYHKSRVAGSRDRPRDQTDTCEATARRWPRGPREPGISIAVLCLRSSAC